MNIIFVILCVFFASSYQTNALSQEELLLKETKTMIEKFANELWIYGKVVTRRDTVVDNYKSAEIVKKDGEIITREIATKIRDMMKEKVAAVQRIMDAAENLAMSSSDEVDSSFQYYDAKELINNLTDPLIENGTTDEPPHAEEYRLPKARMMDSMDTEEYMRDPPQEDENYSDNEEPLEDVAKEVLQVSDGEADSPQASQQETHSSPQEDKSRLNLTENPNFFDIPVNTEHSAVHVPSNVYNRSQEVIQGIKWSEELDNIFKDNYAGDPTLSWQYFGSSTGFMRQFPAMIWHQEPIDTFDCRIRSWYIEAASSPKDIVVLVDRSGSMTGMQKEIAKHVVNNILDTLGNNDYVNIFTFSNVSEPLISCFNDTLVQANLANIRELKEHMDSFKTENIANFSEALTTAFRLLENYRIGSRNKSGAGCNQAIMLITDGVQYNYKELFAEYNWKDWPYRPVRVFTYLIGREVPDIREVKWMACANQGYYVHLSTFAEVREQVLHYIPVMARPMVLWGHKPNPTWSSVYADVTDPKLTNWLWTQRQRREQKERFLSHGKMPNRHTADTDKKFVHQQKKPQDHYGDLQPYTLMTSVSMPVYDRRPNATRVANLLGVAGTDVPIHYIQQLLMPYLIGVNGYAFIITNNGYILIHPDLRPVFQGILKPAYNRVDMAEVELPNDDLGPREFNRTLLEMRKDVVFQRADKKILDMKYHLDNMKRIMRGTRHFYYMGIDETPFTLVVALPHKYGMHKIKYPVLEDIHRQVISTKIDFSKIFNGDKWKIHPDWIYCKSQVGTVKFNSSEEELLYFLKRILHEHWKWSHKNYSCDSNLMNLLVYDAKTTSFFDQNITTTGNEKKGHEFIKKFRITIAFIATHSGLTRWQDFPQNIMPNEENATKLHFSEIHNRAINEVWYRRAVEQIYIEENSFVYSVPFDIGYEKDTLVTVSHAVFVTNKNNDKTPIAVVGYQLYHSSLVAFFKNKSSAVCDLNPKRACYILDNNAYIILSPDPEDTGRWLGDVEYGLMKMLVDENIYNKVHMYDYQAVCFPVKEEPNRGSIMFAPLKHMAQLFHWVLGTVIYFFHIVSGNQEFDTTSEPTIIINQTPTKQNEKEFDKNILINKTSPSPCDERRWLYELVYYKKDEKSPYNKVMQSDRHFIVQPIQYSNLILLVVNAAYKFEDDDEERETPYPEEIDYNTTLACRVREDDLPRRRYAKCINRHINESEIQLCGRSSILIIPTKLTLVIIGSVLLLNV